METWVIFALISAIAAGLHNFMFKVVVERNYNPNLVNALGYLLGIAIMGIYNLYLFSTGIHIGGEEIFWICVFALFNALFFNLSILSRVESMRNIDTVIFFPLYKTFGPLVITGVSFLYFGEMLTQKELLGIIVGMSVPLLLITKTENRIQKNLLLGIAFMLVTVLFSSISASSAKSIAFYEYSLNLFIFATFVFGTVMSFISYKLGVKRSKKQYISEGLPKFCLALGIFHIASFYFFAQALVGNFAVVFTINSFSILVPIILSIIFYGEHFNVKKGMVIALSIVSILLFI